jgi:hypothetical protein
MSRCCDDCCWPFCDMAAQAPDVRFQGVEPTLPGGSWMSHFDPEQQSLTSPIGAYISAACLTLNRSQQGVTWVRTIWVL